MNINPSSEVIAPEARAEILHRLHEAEREHDVKILIAVESGSRAWGFASPNSDYDGRFIYIHRPEWYLSVGLEEQRDVIEYPIVDDMDVNGWDVRKALRLFWKSNPAFIEWMCSPIMYRSDEWFVQQVRELMPQVYSIQSGFYHYRSTAKTTFQDHLRNDYVPLKKYFYVLRPLLAVKWLERFQGIAPIEFEKLLVVIQENTELMTAIHQLLDLKRQSPEMGLAPQVPVIHAFIEAELSRLENIAPDRFERPVNVEVLLSRLFRETLKRAWG